MYSKKTYLSGMIASLFCASASFPAYSNSSSNESIDSTESIEVISVSGTKTERKINEIAASVVSISAQEIDAIGANNIRDLLRYEPGVSVEGSGRFGLSGFNIRGINGDRVLILVDGVPIADEFSFGPALSAGRNFVDIDLLKSVDIVRGPASTLYGSDAIGGVVAFQTKDPIDLLEDKESLAGRAKLGFVSQSNERFANGMLAGVSGDFQWLLNATHRDGEELQSFYKDDDATGSERNSSDPQDNDSTSVLAKLIYQSSPAHRFELIGEDFSQQSDTDLQSEVSRIIRGAVNLSSAGSDRQDRSRFSLQYTYQAQASEHLKRIHVQAFQQNSETAQHTELTRVSLAPDSSPFFRIRDSFFTQEIQGANIQFDHEFEFGGQHYLIYGASFESTHSEGLREGNTRDIASGTAIPEFSVFPARDFPISELFERSVFIQDEIQLLDGKLMLSPGLRYDTFTLTPEFDDLFVAANPGVEISEFDDSQLSKKLGAVYNLSEDYNIWLQYSEGFRIPPMDDVNVGFTNFAGRYTSLANPNLEPESVVSVEAGIRGFTDAMSWTLSAYQNNYDNFIESLSFVGVSQAGFTLFQAINLDEVDISGVEGSFTWYAGESFAELANWQIQASFSIQDSENKETGEEIESILPAQAVLGFQYNTYDDPWRVELALTHTESAQLIANTDTTQFFEAPSATTIDLLGHYQINDSIRVNAGIFNLTNKEFWLASEVRGQNADANVRPFTQPGRNASINVVMTF